MFDALQVRRSCRQAHSSIHRYRSQPIARPAACIPVRGGSELGFSTPVCLVGCLHLSDLVSAPTSSRRWRLTIIRMTRMHSSTTPLCLSPRGMATRTAVAAVEAQSCRNYGRSCNASRNCHALTHWRYVEAGKAVPPLPLRLEHPCQSKPASDLRCGKAFELRRKAYCSICWALLLWSRTRQWLSGVLALVHLLHLIAVRRLGLSFSQAYLSAYALQLPHHTINNTASETPRRSWWGDTAVAPWVAAGFQGNSVSTPGRSLRKATSCSTLTFPSYRHRLLYLSRLTAKDLVGFYSMCNTESAGHKLVPWN